MRRTLIVISVIACLAMTLTIVEADTNYGIGINKTTKTPSSWIASRMEVFWGSQLIGMWSSTQGSMPVLFGGLEVVVYGDFTGYKHIRDVYLTASRGREKFVWKASKQDKKDDIFQANLSRLSPGVYNLRWQVSSQDQARELDLLLFQINTLESRGTAASHHLMVQRASGCESLEQAYALTRGLVPAIATPDPAYLAQQQMLSQMSQPPPVVQPQSSAPTVQPHHPAPVAEEPTDEPVDEGVIVEYGAVLKLHYANFCDTKPRFNGTAKLRAGDILIFRNSRKQKTAEAEIVKVSPRLIEARMLAGQVRGDEVISKK